jgi:hypothetical protein
MFNFYTISKVFAITIRFSLFNWISSDNSDLNYKSLERWKTVNAKMIFMLFSTSYSLFYEQTGIFEHHAHETWPWTCDSVVLKLHKTQTKSGNHEICPYVVKSYVEPMIKIWDCFDKVVMHYV